LQFMDSEAVLKQLGYTPNEALIEQIARIEANTEGYEKIQKHILDLHEQLKVDDSFVALSNTQDYFKVKIEADSDERREEAMERVRHFADKYKVELEPVPGEEMFYIKGFAK